MLKSMVDENRPKRERITQNNHQRNQKAKNQHSQKNIKKTISFSMFLTTNASQDSLKRPKKAPKRPPKNPRPQKIGIQN